MRPSGSKIELRYESGGVKPPVTSLLMSLIVLGWVGVIDDRLGDLV